MAFANLFTGLPALEGDFKSSGQPAFAHRYEMNFQIHGFEFV